MEVFGICGFMFGVTAFIMAMTHAQALAKLKQEVEALKATESEDEKEQR